MEDKLFATRALSDGIWGDEMTPTDTPRTEADAMNELRIKAERELLAARAEIARLREGWIQAIKIALEERTQTAREIAELRAALNRLDSAQQCAERQLAKLKRSES